MVKDTAEYLHAMGKLDQRGYCSGFVTSGLCGAKVKHILSDEKGFFNYQSSRLSEAIDLPERENQRSFYSVRGVDNQIFQFML